MPTRSPIEASAFSCYGGIVDKTCNESVFRIQMVPEVSGPAGGTMSLSIIRSSAIENGLRSSSKDRIGPRSLRCFREQYWYARYFLADYLGIKDFDGLNILEVGTGEAGLLKYFSEKGAKCHGIELSRVRYGYSQILNDSSQMNLIFGDICDPETFENQINGKMDIVILRDVIEHIEGKEMAFRVIYRLMADDGLFFVSFPPRYSPYSGHQQVVRKKWAKLPYLHLLPGSIYRRFLRLAGQPETSVNYLLKTKHTRISIRRMEQILREVGFTIGRKDLFLLRPCYEFRFGVPQMRNPFHEIPLLNEFCTNGALYLLHK